MNENRIYNRHYGNLRGVDLSAAPSEISRSRFADIENMWRDPIAFDSNLTESFPGYRLFAKLPSPIYGIYAQRAFEKSYLVVHAKNTLYRIESALCNHPEDVAAQMPITESMPEEKGCAFSSGDSLYLLVGGKYYRLSAEGDLQDLSEDDNAAYIPTTFYNTEPYEQRNMLTDSVHHAFTADGDYKVKEHPSEGLHFTVQDTEKKLCFVSAKESLKKAVHITIPETHTVGEEVYTVIGIANEGFRGLTELMSIQIPETVTSIGHRAFAGCASLFSVCLPDTLTTLGAQAFYACPALRKVYFGKSFSAYNAEAFAYCPSLTEAYFAATNEEYTAMVEKHGTLFENEMELHFESLPFDNHPTVLFRYPLMEKAQSVSEVSLAEQPLQINFTKVEDGYARYRTVSDGSFITHIELIATKEDLLREKKLRATVALSPSHFATPKGYAAFGNAHPELSGKKAICCCRLAAAYDGRIFLSGNPALPNTVFHTLPDNSGENNPSYVGTLSYFNDGTASTPNHALLSTGNMLIVFKHDSDGEGAIFYHTAESTGIPFIPRIYPGNAGVSGIGAVGEAINFKDDPVFLARDGLLGIEKQSLNLERSICVRSLPVNAKLLKEDLSQASMAVHEGMLYLLAGGNIYLADSRRSVTHSDGSVGYEWYLLTHIGSYTDDKLLYRTVNFLPQGAEEYGVTAAPREGEEATGTVYSVRLPSGVDLYYVQNENGEKYAVDTDGERTGGVFSAACTLCVSGNRLFFGTEDGSLGVFNTDKRGQRLYKLLKSPFYAKKGGKYLVSKDRHNTVQSEDALLTLPLYFKNGSHYAFIGEGKVYLDGGTFSLAEPFGERTAANEIHRNFYSYGAHAYTAACTLAPDDGEMPHYTKDTLARTAAARVKTPKGGALTVLVRTDRTPWHVCESVAAGSADFGDFDFALLDFHGEDGANIPLREKEKRWCFKQFRFAVHGARRPFGLYALSYSYRLSGTLKA